MPHDKKNPKINFELNKSIEPTFEEWVLIFAFPTLLGIFLSFQIAIFFSLTLFLVALLCRYFLIKRKLRKKVISAGIVIWIVTLIYFALDSALTLYAVHYRKIAYEKNIFPQLLWDTFGLIGGEIIRWFVVLAILFFALNKLMHGKPKESLVALLFIIFAFSAWSYVVIDNLHQLIDFFR